jgi:hypothetical protein
MVRNLQNKRFPRLNRNYEYSQFAIRLTTKSNESGYRLQFNVGC